MRRVVALSAIVVVAVGSGHLGAPTSSSAQARRVQVVVLVVDGLDPAEVTPVKTPFISTLREQGTWYEQARAVMVADTLPNHVAMMTGSYGKRSGVPDNNWWSRRRKAEPGVPMEQPRLLRATTLFTAIERQCPRLRTAAILSKTYLHGIFSGDHNGDGEVDADFLWEPGPVIPESDHAPDTATTETVLNELPNEPDLLFVSLGDVDRSGHSDPSGPAGEPAFRDAALQNTDSQVERIVTALRDSGRWDSTVLFLVSDHSMDWTEPHDYISLTSAFNDDPALEGTFVAVQNGGVDNVYLKSKRKRAQRLALMMKIARRIEGVHKVYYTRPNRLRPRGPVVPKAWRLRTRRVGDLLALAKPGYRFSDPSSSSNPVPGNHGHATTRHSVALVAGGAPGIRSRVVEPSAPKKIRPLNDTRKLPEQAENVDVGPTVAWLLGIREPRRQFQGRVLKEALGSRPAESCR